MRLATVFRSGPVFAALLLLLAGWALPVQAQPVTYTLSGQIVDATTGLPLPGANVRLQDRAVGTAADVGGFFSLAITVPPGDYDIGISFIGYRPQERAVTLARETTLDLGTIRLDEDIVRSEEIVVTGTAGPTARKQLGNAISTVDARDLEATASPALDRALQGKFAGALVQQNSGSPAGGVSIRLRGASTVLGSADPLFIIDGVIVNNDSPELIDLGGGAQNRLVDLDPNDIERIEVVKGAAAAALYGSRANNGVVQIFTKRGQQGVPRVTFRTGVRTDAVRKTLDVNEAQDASGAFLNNQGAPLFVNANRQVCDPADGDPACVPGERFDFQDFIFQRAYGTEQYLSVSGGSQGTRYFVSGAHFANEGIVEGSFFRRINGRARLDQTLTNWANLSVGTAFTRSTSDEVPNGGLASNYGALTGFIFGPNTFDPRPVDGRYLNNGILANPVEVIDRYDFGQETRRFIGDAQLNLVPVRGLGIDYVLGVDTYDQAATAFIPRGTSAPGLGGGFSRRSTREFLQVNNDLTVRYETQLTPSVRSNTLVGGTLQYEEATNFSAQSQDLSPVSEVVQSGTSSLAVGEFRTQRTIYGLFAQETLGFAERVFLTVAGRADASSSFGEDERWQFYPKASASYLISDEAFWGDGALGRWVPSFKLRASLGYSGGLTAIGAFDRFTNYAPQSYGGNAGLLPSAQQGALDVKPERQREFEVGADLGLLNERLGLEITYYDQHTTDLLLQRSVAPSTGFLTRLQNVGTLDNRGVEVLVRALPVRTRSLNWTTTLTFATNENEVDGIEEVILTLPSSFGLVAAINGQPLGVFYGDAFERTNDDNDIFIEDGDGDIVLDANGLPVEFQGTTPLDTPTNRKVIGDPNPDWTASWINEFTIQRNLSLRFQLDAAIGGDVFNFTRRLAALSVFGTLQDYEDELEGELPAGYNARVFGIFENWIEDGSYVKLRELALSYTLYPPSPAVRSVRLSLIGRNLLSFDDYSGYDPEINVAGQRTGVRGFDFVEVPIPRTFSLSATLNF